ncbi:MAG: PilZ domain-containing protein [Planctomycetes bacterium]|nr:PilZ domain-containing protein [Planctomycetota bacterium]
MKTERDQRGAIRVELRLPARLTTETGERIDAELRNVSLSGAFFACTANARVRSRLCAEFQTSTEAEPLGAEMEVVRVTVEGIGCRFLALEARTAARLRAFLSHQVRRGLAR